MRVCQIKNVWHSFPETSDLDITLYHWCRRALPGSSRWSCWHGSPTCRLSESGIVQSPGWCRCQWLCSSGGRSVSRSHRSARRLSGRGFVRGGRRVKSARVCLWWWGEAVKEHLGLTPQWWCNRDCISRSAGRCAWRCWHCAGRGWGGFLPPAAAHRLWSPRRASWPSQNSLPEGNWLCHLKILHQSKLFYEHFLTKCD